MKSLKAVVLAAGEGKRLRPITATRPKPLIQIGRKRIIDYLIEDLREAGFGEITIVVAYKMEEVTSYLEDMNYNVEIVVQKGKYGTGGALTFVKDIVEDEFLLYFGDVLTTHQNIKQVVGRAKKTGKMTLGLVRVNRPELYGIVSLSDKKIVDIVEKPKKPVGNLALSGVYMLNSSIFDFLDEIRPSERGELELTEAFKAMLRSGWELVGETLSGDWIDVGTPWDLLKANEYVLREKMQPRVAGNVERGATLLGKVHIGEGSRVKAGAYIEGPVYIGENCMIGPNCYIRPFTTICNGVRIGNAVEIKNSIIMESTNISHLSYVGDSIIGANCNLGAGTVTANVRFDRESVKVKLKGRRVNSGVKKLGVVMGDYAQTGIHVHTMPGVKIGVNSWVGANTIVMDDVEDNAVIYAVQNVVMMKKKS